MILSTLMQEVTELASLAAQGVQANDTNPDGNPMTSVLNTPPANGSVTLNPDGSFSYTPNTGYYGVDSFTYYDENGPATPIRLRCISPFMPRRSLLTMTMRRRKIRNWMSLPLTACLPTTPLPTATPSPRCSSPTRPTAT